MTAEPNIDLERNPFTDPFADEPSPGARTIDAAERLKQAAGDNVRRLRAAAEAGFRNFRESGDDPPAAAGGVKAPNWDELRSKMKDLHRDGEAWARENPTAAVAIAAGAGFVLGLLLRR